MPAARPTQAAVANAIAALVKSGLTPSAVVVNADGSFQIEVGLPAGAASGTLHEVEKGSRKWGFPQRTQITSNDPNDIIP